MLVHTVRCSTALYTLCAALNSTLLQRAPVLYVQYHGLVQLYTAARMIQCLRAWLVCCSAALCRTAPLVVVHDGVLYEVHS
jgi:hypothetical protein